MTQRQSKPRKALPVIRPVPPFPPFDPTEVPPKPKLYRLMVKAVTKKVLHAPFSMHTYMALRRTVLPQILPDELLYRWKPYRKGECNRCGACCRIQFECPFVIEDDGPNVTHCAIYQIESAPKACHNYPIDPLDLHMLQREIDNVCTFYFEGEPEPIPRFEYLKMVAKHVWSRRNRKRRPALETGE